MGQRVTEILICICGMLTIVFLALLGVNIYLAARTGGRWKRKLLSAGLLLLGAAGLMSCDSQATATTSIAHPAKQPASSSELQDTEEWHKISSGWQAVAPLAESGKSTGAERDKAIKAMATARAAIKELAEAGRITQAEAGLLDAEAERLIAEMQRNPPTDCQVMCYDMAYLPPAYASLTRLNARLPLLREMAESGKVKPAVIERTLPAIEADLKTLVSEEELAKLQEEPREQARAAATETAKLVERIKASLKVE